MGITIEGGKLTYSSGKPDGGVLSKAASSMKSVGNVAAKAAVYTAVGGTVVAGTTMVGGGAGTVFAGVTMVSVGGYMATKAFEEKQSGIDVIQRTSRDTSGGQDYQDFLNSSSGVSGAASIAKQAMADYEGTDMVPEDPYEAVRTALASLGVQGMEHATTHDAFQGGSTCLPQSMARYNQTGMSYSR